MWIHIGPEMLTLSLSCLRVEFFIVIRSLVWPGGHNLSFAVTTLKMVASVTIKATVEYILSGGIIFRPGVPLGVLYPCLRF
jgi:hypothetical protein